MAETVPGHRVTVEGWAKYVPSESGVQRFLGIDPTGDEDFWGAQCRLVSLARPGAIG